LWIKEVREAKVAIFRQMLQIFDKNMGAHKFDFASNFGKTSEWAHSQYFARGVKTTLAVILDL